MKYMMMIAGSETEGGVDEERSTAAYQRIVEWWNGHAEAGRIVEGYQLEPSSTATTVRIGTTGSSTVTDGPWWRSTARWRSRSGTGRQTPLPPSRHWPSALTDTTCSTPLGPRSSGAWAAMMRHAPPTSVPSA